MKFCPECGAKLAGDAPKFCGECGHKLEVPGSAGSPASGQADAESSTEEGSPDVRREDVVSAWVLVVSESDESRYWGPGAFPGGSYGIADAVVNQMFWSGSGSSDDEETARVFCAAVMDYEDDLHDCGYWTGNIAENIARLTISDESPPWVEDASAARGALSDLQWRALQERASTPDWLGDDTFLGHWEYPISGVPVLPRWSAKLDLINRLRSDETSGEEIAELVRLADSSSLLGQIILVYAAGHAHCPPSTQMELAVSGDLHVRYTLLCNEHASEEARAAVVLSHPDTLSQFDNEYVMEDSWTGWLRGRGFGASVFQVFLRREEIQKGSTPVAEEDCDVNYEDLREMTVLAPLDRDRYRAVERFDDVQGIHGGPPERSLSKWISQVVEYDSRRF